MEPIIRDWQRQPLTGGAVSHVRATLYPAYCSNTCIGLVALDGDLWVRMKIYEPGAEVAQGQAGERVGCRFE